MSSGVQVKGRTVFNNSDINTPDIDNPDIDGGTVDSTSLGNVTPASGAFTTLKASTDPVDEHGVGDRAFTDARYCLESNNLSDVDTSVTAFNNIKQAATESATGVMEKATTAEVVTGTDTDRAVTPAGVTARMEAPGSIGGTTPASGEFTILKASTDPVDEHGVGDRAFNDGRYIANPLTAQLGIGEYDLKLDSLLSTDGKYSGITCDGVLGATIAFGDLVYLNTTDQRWELADADAETTAGDVMLAIVLVGGDDGDTRLLLLRGFIREDDWNFTSYGQAMFVGLTAGDMVQDVSGYTTGDIVRVIGHASTFADQIYFNPDGTWLEVA